MAIITQTELDDFQAAFSEHWPFFASFHSIVVWKEPRKILSDLPPSTSYPGYGTESIQANVIYEPVSGVFPVMMVKENEARFGKFQQTRNLLPEGQIKVKVSGDCKDFIINGKTELVQIDGQTFNVVSQDTHQDYGIQQYHYFTLQRTY